MSLSDFHISLDFTFCSACLDSFLHPLSIEGKGSKSCQVIQWVWESWLKKNNNINLYFKVAFYWYQKRGNLQVFLKCVGTGVSYSTEDVLLIWKFLILPPHPERQGWWVKQLVRFLPSTWETSTEFPASEFSPIVAERGVTGFCRVNQWMGTHTVYPLSFFLLHKQKL